MFWQKRKFSDGNGFLGYYYYYQFDFYKCFTLEPAGAGGNPQFIIIINFNLLWV